jgi:hypothetical protein
MLNNLNESLAGERSRILHFSCNFYILKLNECVWIELPVNRTIVIESPSILILDQCECVSQLSEAHCSQLPYRVQSRLLLHTAASIKIAANTII